MFAHLYNYSTLTLLGKNSCLSRDLSQIKRAETREIIYTCIYTILMVPLQLQSVALIKVKITKLPPVFIEHSLFKYKEKLLRIFPAAVVD